MRVAAIYDIHGNLPALEAVLRQIVESDVDRIVVGGDVVPGPMPEQTLTTLLQLDTPVDFIFGNGEIAVLQQLAGEQPAAVPEAFRPIIEWTAAQLSSEHQQRLRTWPKTLQINTPTLGGILFCHATPRNENEIFTKLTPVDRLTPVFSEIDADVVVCGHTHMQFDRRIGTVRVVNAGSVGMPFGQVGACWLLIDRDLRFRHTAYDLQIAAERIRRTEYPQAEHFATNNVLTVPSEQQMLEAFAYSEIR